jgi:hypothetical protein
MKGISGSERKPATYFPPAERTGKSLMSEMPPSNVNVTGTEPAAGLEGMVVCI